MAGKMNEGFIYKFIVAQVKSLACDHDGYPVYMKSFDKMFCDLYGLQAFSERLSKSYNNREMKDLIDKVGVNQLFRLFKNKDYYMVIRDLVQIQRDRDKLRKKIQKERRKNGGTKDLRYTEKEYNDLTKLYNRCIKTLKKHLNIKNVHKLYKEKYRGLRDFAGQNHQDLYWDDIDVGLTDDIYDYDDRDDRFFDDDDSTILEDFMRELNGGSPKASRRRRDYDYPFEYADLEDDDEDDNLTDLEDKVDRLCNSMKSLENIVLNNSVRKSTTSRQRSNRTNRQTQSDDIADIKDAIQIVANKVVDLDDRLSDFEEYIDDDDDDFENPLGYVNPVVEKMRQQQGENRPNTDSSASDLINAINETINNAPEMTRDML